MSRDYADYEGQAGKGGEAIAGCRDGYRGPGGCTHHGAGQGRYACHQAALPELLPHRLRRPVQVREGLDYDSGVYFSGDVALRDADNYYMVVGRADDVLNVAGHRIGSAEVESALVSHPAVAEAAVIGKPDEIKGEQIKGFVTLRAGESGSDDMVKSLKLHVRKELGTDSGADGDRLHAGAAQDEVREDHAPAVESAGVGARPRRYHDAGGLGRHSLRQSVYLTGIKPSALHPVRNSRDLPARTQLGRGRNLTCPWTAPPPSTATPNCWN